MANRTVMFGFKIVHYGIFLGLAAFLTLAGCAGRDISPDSRRLSDLRPEPPKLKTVDIAINREKLRVALANRTLFEKLRVVEVFQGGRPSAIPMYRLFDVDPRSVFAMLSLKNGDVLVAANDRVLANNGVFFSYVELLPRAQEAQIELIRDGVPTLFRYKIQG